jgi:hypothetical protein
MMIIRITFMEPLVAAAQPPIKKEVNSKAWEGRPDIEITNGVSGCGSNGSHLEKRMPEGCEQRIISA